MFRALGIFKILSVPSGWRRNAAAFIFGVMGTLTMAPLFLFPLLIISFAGLFRLVDNASSQKRAFADGWWWGWGYHMTGLYWFCIALLTEPDKFAWLIPFALFALTGVIALYPAIACWLTSKVRAQGIARVFLFSVIWMLVEFARAHLFSGFPWNMAGYSLAFSDDVLQAASVVGIYGMTWFAVFFGAIPAVYADSRVSKRAATITVLGVVAVLIFTASWGGGRLAKFDSLPESSRYVEGVHLRLVQANIAQHHKWDPRLQMQGLQQHVRMMLSPGLEKVTHVIWPETAVPYLIRSDTPLTHMLGSAIPKSTLLITGGLRADGAGDDVQMYNSIVAIDAKGEIVGSYDKHKLVPFGEFLPLRFILPLWMTTPVGPKDFGSGKGPMTVNWPGLPGASPLVCYEAIFPELAVSSAERPRWLLNLTNDAWFGQSSGPHQHFHMARTRAVEQGLPLVRVANTGITAVTDRFGQVLSKLDLGEQGILDIRLPKAKERPTFYARYGDWIIGLLMFVSAILIIRSQKVTTS